MFGVTHHLPDHLLADYVAGRLAHPFAVVAAAHVSLCAECRAAVEAHEALGGLVLEGAGAEPISDAARRNVMALLDAPDEAPPPPARSGIYPGAVMAALKGGAPRWRALGNGAAQHILWAGKEGSVRLLRIPPGGEMPDHGHRGLELTLVLQGSFHDETGRFGVGDVEVADEELEHTPIADEGAECICLAATDAPLRFLSLIPKLAQPFFRI